jgi:hypothetical protein
MSRYIATLTLIGICFCGTALAQNRSFGFGLIFLGETGLSLKKQVGRSSAIASGISGSYQDRESFGFYADYLLDTLTVSPNNTSRFSLYHGFGGRYESEARQHRETDDYEIGIRLPFGMGYIFTTPPIDVFFEVVPIFDFWPNIGLGLTGGIGVRYLF